MSLIQDALKRKREEEAVAPPQEAPPPPSEPQTAKPANKLKPTPDKPLILLILLIIISLISIGIIKFNRAPAATPKTIPQQPAETVETTKAPSAVAKVIEKITGDGWPELKLTGFAAGGGQRMVFINGKMLAEGREIDGARIVQIGKAEVLVEFKGERRILRVDDQ